MLRIDAHQHFWYFDPIRDAWINSDMAVIQRDFLPEDLAPLLRQHGFDGCVVVQSDQTENENRFQLANAEAHDFIKGVVGWVNFWDDQVGEQLAELSQFPKMKGFRHVLQGASDPALMLQPAFRRGIGMLRPYNFTYDILIYPNQLPFIPEFVSEFPDQPFVIDHLAKPYIKEKKVKAWHREMVAVASFENVYCKVSGLVTEADWYHWRPEDFTPYLDSVVDAFGVERLLFGSDWPVCLVAGSYERMLGIVTEYFSSFTQNEQDQVFGGNAVKFYNLI